MGQSYKISEDYLLRSICGEYVVLPVGEAAAIRRSMMTPNESAVRIWQEFMKAKTEDAVATALAEEYEASYEQILTDVHRFVVEAVQLGILIEIEEADK